MPIIDKKTGKIKPFAEWGGDKPRPPRDVFDSSLVLFATRIPSTTLEKFTAAVKKNGDKIQTVIKRMMEGYIKDVERGDDERTETKSC